MNALRAFHQRMGALLAADGIPLHYGDLRAEYRAALDCAVLLDRSHEGRILLEGESRFELVNRMSTNDLLGMSSYEGRPTIFTSANARILFRAMCYSLPEGLLMISEPGQGQALCEYLRRKIFFGDKVSVRDLAPSTAQFAVHGPKADSIVERMGVKLPAPGSYCACDIALAGASATAAMRKAIVGGHWTVVCPAARALDMYRQILDRGRAFELRLAGSLSYNLLRIRGGRPAGLELSSERIPLEVGLWDEVSFEKGCYTGQEIIARMESRQRLARVLVRLELAGHVEAPAAVYSDGKVCGKLTSSAVSPDDEYFALALIKRDSARAGTALEVGDARLPARLIGYAGVQPAFVTN